MTNIDVTMIAVPNVTITLNMPQTLQQAGSIDSKSVQGCQRILKHIHLQCDDAIDLIGQRARITTRLSPPLPKNRGH